MRIQGVYNTCENNLEGMLKMGKQMRSDEYEVRANEIADLIEMLGSVKLITLNKLIPNCDKIIHKMVKLRRYILCPNNELIGMNKNAFLNPQRIPLDAAFKIYTDAVIRGHAVYRTFQRENQPLLASFVFENATIYEVIHVKYGNRKIKESIHAKDKINKFTKRILLLENEDDANKISIPGTDKIVIITNDGQIHPFKKERKFYESNSSG